MGQSAKSFPQLEREAVDRDAPAFVREGTPDAAVAAQHFAAVAAELSDGVAVVRLGTLVWANDRLVALAGRSALQEFQGSVFGDLFKDTGRGLPEPSGSRFLECALRRTDGEARTVICRLAWNDPDAGVSAWVVEDVTHVRCSRRSIEPSRPTATRRVGRRSAGGAWNPICLGALPEASI